MVVVEDRDLADGPRERDGELAARVHLADEDLHRGGRRAAAALPAPEERVHLRGEVGERERAAGAAEADERASKRGDLLDEGNLRGRERDVAARLLLAAHPRHLAEAEQDDVGVARGGDGLGAQGRVLLRRRRVVPERAPAGDADLRLREEAAGGVEERLAVHAPGDVGGGGAPVAEVRVDLVPGGADEGDLPNLAGVEGKNGRGAVRRAE